MYIQLVRVRNDELIANNLGISVAKTAKEIKKREQKVEDLKKELFSHRNRIIDMVADSGKVFTLRTEDGNDVTKDYLETLDIDTLLDKVEALYTKLKKLD